MAPPPFFRPSTAAHPCQPAAFKRPGGPTRVRVRPRLDQTRSLPSLVSPRTYDPARGEVPSSRRMVAGPGFGRATQLNLRSSKVRSRPTNPADRSGPEPAVGHPSSAVAPSSRATSTAARTALARPLAANLCSEEQARQQPDRVVLLALQRSRRLLRPLSATAYRDRGPQAHPPTGWSDRAARTPRGVLVPDVIDWNLRRFPPESHPTANSVRVLQKAMHQQRRVFRDVANSGATSPRSRSRTSRVVSIGILHPSEAIGRQGAQARSGWGPADLRSRRRLRARTRHQYCVKTVQDARHLVHADGHAGDRPVARSSEQSGRQQAANRFPCPGSTHASYSRRPFGVICDARQSHGSTATSQ